MATTKKTATTGTLVTVNPAETVLGKWHKRKPENQDDPDFLGLVQSMRLEGVIEPAVGRRAGKTDPIEIVAGTRRRAAAIVANVPLPVFLRNLTDGQAKRITLSENLHRKDLTPMEEAETINELVKDGATYAEISAETSKSTKWVALHANLVNLSDKWKAAIENPARYVSTWPARLLVLIGRLPHNIQDEIKELEWKADDAGDDRLPTSTELAGDLARAYKLLKSTPWDPNDAQVAKKCGACSTCPKRSDHVPELFDENDFPEIDRYGHVTKKKPNADARCLDHLCWDTKLTSHIKRTADDAAKAKKPLTFVSSTYSPNAFDGKTPHRADEWRKAGKADAKKRPAIVVDGPDAGKIIDAVVGRENLSSSKSTSTTTRNTNAKARPLAERRRNLNKLRRRIIVGNLILQIDDIAEGKTPSAPRTYAEDLALVATFGTEPIDLNRRGSDFELLVERSRQSIEDLYPLVFKGALVELRKVLHMVQKHDSLSETDIRTACEYVGLDYDTELAKAEEAKPEPKSWATLTAAGTPKKTPTKKKATTSSGPTKTKPRAKGKPKTPPAKSPAKKKAATKRKPAAAPAAKHGATTKGDHVVTLRCVHSGCKTKGGQEYVGATKAEALAHAVELGWFIVYKDDDKGSIHSATCPVCNG